MDLDLHQQITNTCTKLILVVRKYLNRDHVGPPLTMVSEVNCARVGRDTMRRTVFECGQFFERNS